MKKIICILFIFFSIICNYVIAASPWVNTEDEYLRADIDLLADIGVISVPVTTYPLMWSGIVESLDKVDISQIPIEYKNIYWRVKKAAKFAVAEKAESKLRLTLGNELKNSYDFGDLGREKTEIAASSKNMKKYFAWNLQVTRVYKADLGKPTRYDGSYIAGIVDNWAISVGKIERWWGPSFATSSILSNNIIPPIGISIQRNYSEKTELPLINFLGPWSITAFTSRLYDDIYYTDNSTFSGASLNFKPLNNIEFAFRGTRSKLTDKNNIQLNTNTKLIEKVGIDTKIKLPINKPISVYASYYKKKSSLLNEYEEVNSKQFGVTGSFIAFDTHWRWFVESIDNHFDELYSVANNTTRQLTNYNNNIFFYDEKSNSAQQMGLISRINKTNDISFFLSKSEEIKNNNDSNALKLKWRYRTKDWGFFDTSLDYSKNSNLKDNKRISVSWIRYL